MGKGIVYAQYLVSGVIAIALACAYFAMYVMYGQLPCSTRLPIWTLVSGTPLAVHGFYRENNVINIVLRIYMKH